MDQLTMTVREMAKQMSISLPKAYELVKRPDFPMMCVGKKILIPIESFKEWLRKETTKD